MEPFEEVTFHVFYRKLISKLIRPSVYQCLACDGVRHVSLKQTVYSGGDFISELTAIGRCDGSCRRKLVAFNWMIPSNPGVASVTQPESQAHFWG